MARLVLFILFAIWEVGSESATGQSPSSIEIYGFLGGFLTLVLITNLWGYLARNHRQTAFLRAVWTTRQLTVIWFALGVFRWHWADQINAWIGPTLAGPNAKYPLESISAFFGTLPALAAWIGIIISKYHSERSTRDETILHDLDEGLPVHPIGGLRSYLSATLRLDLLFTIVPIGMILLLRDAGTLITIYFAPSAKFSAWAEPAISILAAGFVFLTAPVILTKVLDTRPLAPSPLRTRLEAMCSRAGLRYRQILLWHTDNHMGNAAVMGVLPQVRYILLSDLLLETMSDEQIEAVFAHELGHVVHKHLTWLGLFVLVLLLATLGPAQWIGNLSSAHLPGWMANVLLPVVEAVGGLLLLFGGLSRYFERQADVYAARTIDWQHRPTDATAGPQPPIHPRRWPVGAHGATVFGSALYCVALINGIPIASRNLSHGSIAGRIDYLHRLSAEPIRTRRFDQMMAIIYFLVIALLIGCGIWSAVVIAHG